MMIAIALGGDAFSVALGAGAGKRFKGQRFRLSFHFGLFQMLMPLIGWSIGTNLVYWISFWDHWVASGVLFIIAIHMFYEALFSEHKERETDLSRGWYLVLLSVATSIDALAIGLVFGVLDIDPLIPCIIIGLVAGFMTIAGLYLGRKLRASFGQTVEIASGFILLFLGLKFLTL